MLPINHKQLVTGATWELRVKFKEDTKAKYHLLKENYQFRIGRSHSDSSFIALMIEELFTISSKG